MPSIVDLCNAALNQLGANTITALTDETKPAKLCNQRFTFVRDAVMRAHPWNCLISRVTLSAESSAPAFGFDKQYVLPTDPFCLRVLNLSSLDLVYRVEGRKILTNESTLNLVYVGRDVDPNNYDTLLTESIIAHLSADLAYPLVGSSSLQTQFYNLYQEKLKEARFVDATEGTPGAISSVTEPGGLQSDVFTAARL
tara:strand:+ start:389 stop:979 length:591 start_codon:yes stop_codon:yes gene_type:complete